MTPDEFQAELDANGGEWRGLEWATDSVKPLRTTWRAGFGYDHVLVIGWYPGEIWFATIIERDLWDESGSFASGVADARGEGPDSALVALAAECADEAARFARWATRIAT